MDTLAVSEARRRAGEPAGKARTLGTESRVRAGAGAGRVWRGQCSPSHTTAAFWGQVSGTAAPEVG